MITIKNRNDIQYWDINDLYGWEMSQKSPAKSFEQIKDTSQFSKDSEKNYNEESDQGYFLEFDVQYTNYTKKFNELHNDLLVLPERMKIQKVENIEASLHYKYE